MKKTYFGKSVKSFTYALELLANYKKNMAEGIVFKADCLFNLALAHWAQGSESEAMERMQECYKVRMNGIGKNSM
jgi:hypothetical protein